MNNMHDAIMNQIFPFSYDMYLGVVAWGVVLFGRVLRCLFD